MRRQSPFGYMLGSASLLIDLTHASRTDFRDDGVVCERRVGGYRFAHFGVV